jgi:hypothetical protein
MATVFRALLLVAIACLSALGLLAWLPFGKEGASWTDLPIVGGIAAAAMTLGVVWWFAAGRETKRAWTWIGWIVLLPPLLAHGHLAISLAIARIGGLRLADSVVIESYRETPILWPGFDGPVGVEIALELRHRGGAEAMILPPEIHMGPDLDVDRDRLSASLTNGSGYLNNYFLNKPVGDLALLKTVLFQRVFESPRPGDPNYRWESSVRFDPSGTTRLAYALLPGTIDYLPARDRVCLSSGSYGVPACAAGQGPESGCAAPNDSRADPPAYAEGGDLSALWIAAGAHDLIADLSGPLAAAMRERSRLQANPAEWTAMQRRLEPDGLARAGYALCPAGADSHTRFRTCYCRVE